MNVVVLCSSASHPVYPWLQRWCNERRSEGHTVSLVTRVPEIPEQGGDILFLISCGEIIREEIRRGFRKVLVIHASDLPQGRGWSPHIWEIVNGAGELTVTLLEAAEPVDAGAIWAKRRVRLDGTELYDEINEKLFREELGLMSYALEHFETIRPQPQPEIEEVSYYRRRTPSDSEIDPHRSIAEQFDLLRVCDPNRFPAFFRYRGATYRITIEKVKDEE